MLMYSRYEVHLPFMMGSLRPSPHTALPQTTPVAEPIEGSTKETANQIRQLQHQVESMKLELAKQNLSIEHQSTASTRASRPSSVENPLRERERSLSNQRSNKEDSDESGLRQRSTPNNIGFKQEFLPD